MIYSFKEKAKKAIKLVKEERLIIYLILYLFIAYIFVAYIDWYNKNVVSILSQFKSNIWMQLLTGVLIVIAVYDLKSKLRLRYHYDRKVILPLFLVSILLAYYRIFTERYNYIYWICPVSYVDVIWIFGFVYSIVASVNYYRTYRIKCIRNKEKSPKDVIFLDFLYLILNCIIIPFQWCYKLLDRIFTIRHIDVLIDAILKYYRHPLKALDVLRHTILKYYRLRRIKLYKKYKGKDSNNKILSDYPIEAKEEDIFSFDNDVNKLADEINCLDRKKTWSIAITAP